MKHRGADPDDIGALEGRWHLGRSWPGQFPYLEAACPCPKGRCGLAAPIESVHCAQHHGQETLRQGHPADECASFIRRRRWRLHTRHNALPIA